MKYVIITIVTFLSLGAYFLLNPSYEKSLESKYYYMVGEYDTAETLAKEAFSLNPYNRMAATVMTQSQTALIFVRYIDQSKKYIHEISKMAESKSIDDAEKAKIKLMSEIMIDSYKKVISTVFIDKKLVEEAAHYHKEFVELNEKVSTQ